MSSAVTRVLWPVAVLVAFGAGWAISGTAARQRASVERPDASTDVVRLQQQVESLQARLRARESLAATSRATETGARRIEAPGFGDDRLASRERRGDPPGVPPIERAASTATAPSRETAATPPTVTAALERFYKYLEATTGEPGRERWRQARELVDELRAMGPPAAQALMQVLSAGNDSEERRAAARLLGSLQVAQALPLLRDVIERDNDILLRRAAAAGLRQLQTSDAIPVMERMLAQPGEDRFVRLSAAVGLAESGKPQGLNGLVHIFDEASGDGRGREMAFRALTNLKDERPVPFMRQLLTSQAEPGYRLQAIRYLSAQGDQQSLATLHMLMSSPTEQPSIRDAAAQAHAIISGSK